MNPSTNNVWRRLGYALSFVVVAGVAGVVSYSHIRDVALHGHQSPLIAHLMPLSIDGMMLIATLAMAEDKAANRFPRGWARFGFWFGAVISTAANVAATVVAYGWEPLSIAISGIAPVVLLLAIEIVARPGKPRPVVTTVPVAPVAGSGAVPEAEQAATPELTADDAQAEDLPEAPVSPAVTRERKPYGGRSGPNGDEYAERTKRLHRRGK